MRFLKLRVSLKSPLEQHFSSSSNIELGDRIESSLECSKIVIVKYLEEESWTLKWWHGGKNRVKYEADKFWTIIRYFFYVKYYFLCTYTWRYGSTHILRFL